MSHKKIVCECGVTVAQCRCPSPDKVVTNITHTYHLEHYTITDEQLSAILSEYHARKP